MDVANKIQEKLNKILGKLKKLGIIETFKLEINFCPIKKILKRNLVEIDSVLKKCLKKITRKPKKAEIRNIIGELVRKKNLNDSTTQEPVTITVLSKKSFSTEPPADDNTVDTEVLTFQCGFCNEIFKSKKSFAVHKKEHKYSEIFLCDKCGKVFYSFKKWRQHEQEYTEQSHIKKNCKAHFVKELTKESIEEVKMGNTSSESFGKKCTAEEEEKLKNSHLESKSESTVTKKTQEKFMCICGKVFNILKTFRKHNKLKHSRENIKQHICDTCGKSFLEKGKLNRHMLSHRKSQYQCSVCCKQFSRSDTLKRHVSLFHSTSKEFLCSFCQKKFKLKFNRDVHEENVHKNVDSWVQCQHCEQKFRNKITLKSHQKIHSDSRITCTSCCKSFSRKSYYKIHMESKHSCTVIK